MAIRSATENNVRRVCTLLTVGGIGAFVWAAVEVDAIYAVGAVLTTLFLLWVGTVTGGPQFTLLYNLLGVHAPIMEIRTKHVAPGWESVVEAFETNLRRGIEAGAQLTVWHKGKCVVNYCGVVQSRARGAEDLSEYGEDSMQLVWSTSKVLTSLVAAILVDRGFIKYDTKVVDVWPEFVAHGREELTFSDILKHEAGLARAPKVDVGDFSRG
jgi:CubicO group peptidase (beta-lactamase class C family)